MEADLRRPLAEAQERVRELMSRLGGESGDEEKLQETLARVCAPECSTGCKFGEAFCCEGASCISIGVRACVFAHPRVCPVIFPYTCVCRGQSLRCRVRLCWSEYMTPRKNILMKDQKYTHLLARANVCEFKCVHMLYFARMLRCALVPRWRFVDMFRFPWILFCL